jgi:anthranilate phosphoribosyltransferase
MSLANTNIVTLIRKLVLRNNLSENEICLMINLILEGKVSETLLSALLVAFTMKGETALEIKIILQAIKKHAIRIRPNISGLLIDTCGTGGGMKSFNISTAAAVVACSAGCKVAKHGNRSVSSICGSADFLEYIGLDLNSPPEKVSEAIENIGIGFLFAPKYHPAMSNISAVRKKLGIRTIFNIIGPLCNPCTNISSQVIGIFDPSLIYTIASALKTGRDVNEIMLVHGYDGFDELSNTCENLILWIVEDQIKRIRLHPKMLNVQIANPKELLVDSKESSIKYTLQVIYGLATKEREDIVVMNASAALVMGRIAKDLREGVEIARTVIKQGKPEKKLSELIHKYGNSFKLEEAERKFLL